MNEDLMFQLRAPNIDMIDLDDIYEKHKTSLDEKYQRKKEAFEKIQMEERLANLTKEAKEAEETLEKEEE